MGEKTLSCICPRVQVSNVGTVFWNVLEFIFILLELTVVWCPYHLWLHYVTRVTGIGVGLLLSVGLRDPVDCCVTGFFQDRIFRWD